MLVILYFYQRREGGRGRGNFVSITFINILNTEREKREREREREKEEEKKHVSTHSVSSQTYITTYYTICLYLQHAHFIPIVGVGKERRALIGPW